LPKLKANMAGSVLRLARSPSRRSSAALAFAGAPNAALTGVASSPTNTLLQARCPLRHAPVLAAHGRFAAATPRPPWRACASDATLASGTDSAADVDTTSRFAAGDAVRVSKSVIMYHMPGSKNEPTDVKGKTGIVSKIISTANNIRITATKPVVVKFDNMKVSGHFEDDELEPA
jgi:hypothetical protein